MPPLHKILLFLFVFVSFSTAYGQDTTGNDLSQTVKYRSGKNLPKPLQDTLKKVYKNILKNDPKSKDKFPSVVLVQLSSEHNRIKALEKDKKNKLLKEVNEDALTIRDRMIKDFTTNFKYCPVYYFIDTNAYLVKAGKLEGILLNADGSAASVTVTGDYLIAYYGHLSQKYKPWENVQDSMWRENDADLPFGTGLVITDKKFRVLTYFYKQQYHGVIWKATGENKTPFESKRFDMEYYSFAPDLNTMLYTSRTHLKLWVEYIRAEYNIKKFQPNKLLSEKEEDEAINQ